MINLTCHVIRQLLAVVVGILDVRSSESNALVDRVRVGLTILDGSVTLTLHNDANGRIIGKVGTDAIGDTDNHLAGANVVLADRSESLEIPVRKIGVTTLAVLDGGSSFTGIVGLGDEGFAATNTPGVLDDGVPGAESSCVVEELYKYNNMYMYAERMKDICLVRTTKMKYFYFSYRNYRSNNLERKRH